jgi:polyferredoxin
MSELIKPKRARRTLWLRTAIQVFFFLLVAAIAVNHTLAEQAAGAQPFSFLPYASVHAICPFGGIENIYYHFTTGGFLKKITESSGMLMMIVFIMTLFLGPVFCSWVCPFGSIQEWIGKLGKQIFKRRYNRFIPYRFDRYLRYARYLVLVWVIYMTATSATLFFADYDPYFLLFHFWTGEVAIGGMAFLTLTLLASLFVERPWCKYACPYGAVLGIFNLFSIFRIKRQESTCTSCKLCTRTCPMNIPVEQMKTVRNHQCIRCMECTSEAVCPVGDTVTFSAGK